MEAAHNHDHSHKYDDHSHNHGHDVNQDNRKSVTIVLCLTATFMVIEFLGGLWTGSLALLADAGHMLSDVAALALSLFAFYMARRPRTSRRTFGFHRTEILAALFNGATLIAAAVIIMLEAYERLVQPEQVRGAAMMVVAIAGLIVNVFSLKVLHGGHERNLNMKGAYLHVIGDALGSLGAILAGLAVWLFGWYRADPIISVIISLLIVWSSWNLVRQSVAVLMEGTPGGIDVDEVEKVIRQVPGVYGVHDLHVWSITSGFVALSVHAVIAEEIGAGEWQRVLQDIRTRLHDGYGIHHVTVQLEPVGFLESGGCV